MNKKIFITIIILVAVLILGGYLITKANKAAPVDIVVDVNAPTKLAASYSLSNISTHNKAADCWLAINGKVYDVTSFIASGQHNDKILNGCGLDATAMFSQVAKHEGAKAQSILPTLQIGVLK